MAAETASPVAVAAPIDEKKPGDSQDGLNSSVAELPVSEQTTLQRWVNKLDRLPGLETRGIERVPEELRHPKVTSGSYVQMFLIWFAINCTANNMVNAILLLLLCHKEVTDVHFQDHGNSWASGFWPELH